MLRILQYVRVSIPHLFNTRITFPQTNVERLVNLQWGRFFSEKIRKLKEKKLKLKGKYKLKTHSGFKKRFHIVFLL